MAGTILVVVAEPAIGLRLARTRWTARAAMTAVSQLRRNLVSIFKQPPSFSRAHAPRGLRYFPLKRRGGRSAETALVRIAAPRWPASRSGRSPARGDRRSMTGAPPGAPPRRFLSSGHASRLGHLLSRPVRQPAPGGALLVAPKWSPEGLPSPGVRDLCAGAAPCSISKTPPEDALCEQDEA